jgi:hypothetical protein
MKPTKTHDERIAGIGFGALYPAYVTKVERKGRTKAELVKVLTWLTGYTGPELTALRKRNVTMAEFFKKAKVHKNAKLITGVICGYRIEDIPNPLTKKIRYMDKVVDELAKGRDLAKIIRT